MTGPSARRVKSDAPAKLGPLTSDTLRPRIGSKTTTTTAVAALIAISALIAPADAFATPTPLTAPGCSIDATNTAAGGKHYQNCDCDCYTTSTTGKRQRDCECYCDYGYNYGSDVNGDN
jgi:hypothetical protein